MRGPQPEKAAEKPVSEETTMLVLRPPPVPSSVQALEPAPPEAAPPGTLAIGPSATESAARESSPIDATGTVPSDPSSPEGEATAIGGEGQQPVATGAAVPPAPAKEGLFSGTLLDPAEEAARAAAAAEVQAQQEAAMADLEAKANSPTQGPDAEAPAVGQVYS